MLGDLCRFEWIIKLWYHFSYTRN